MNTQSLPRKRARVSFSLEVLREALLLPADVEIVDIARAATDWSRGTITFFLAGAGLPDEAAVPPGPPGDGDVELLVEYRSVRVPSYPKFERFVLPDDGPGLPVTNPEVAAKIDRICAEGRAREASKSRAEEPS